MIRPPKIMPPDPVPGRNCWGELRKDDAEQDGQEDDEGDAEKRSQDAAEAADDDHEQDVERCPQIEGLGIDVARVRHDMKGAGDATVEGAHGKGRELAPERPDADDFGRDVVVTDRHPGPPDGASHQVLGQKL